MHASRLPGPSSTGPAPGLLPTAAVGNHPATWVYSGLMGDAQTVRTQLRDGAGRDGVESTWRSLLAARAAIAAPCDTLEARAGKLRELGKHANEMQTLTALLSDGIAVMCLPAKDPSLAEVSEDWKRCLGDVREHAQALDATMDAMRHAKGDVEQASDADAAGLKPLARSVLKHRQRLLDARERFSELCETLKASNQLEPADVRVKYRTTIHAIDSEVALLDHDLVLAQAGLRLRPASTGNAAREQHPHFFWSKALVAAIDNHAEALRWAERTLRAKVVPPPKKIRNPFGRKAAVEQAAQAHAAEEAARLQAVRSLRGMREALQKLLEPPGE